jgi:hypothetical protein
MRDERSRVRSVKEEGVPGQEIVSLPGTPSFG